MRFLYHKLFILAVVVLLAACGDAPESTEVPTSIPAATPQPTSVPTLEPSLTPVPTNTVAASESFPSAPESPLDQPDSPLLQPDSPLQPPQAEGNGGQAFGPIEQLSELARVIAPATPSEGRASVSGLIYSYTIDRVVPGTRVYLTKALESDGKFFPPPVFRYDEQSGDTGSFTDELGRFTISEVTPGDYYLVTWTVYDYILMPDPDTGTDAQIIHIEANDQLNLGVIQISWP